MTIPICLLLGQLGLWYQFRPLQSGEQALVVATLNSSMNTPWPETSIDLPDGSQVLTGPCRVNKDRQEIWWTIQAGEPGRDPIAIHLDDKEFSKEFVVGEDLQRVSAMRPSRQWLDLTLHPWEKPFEAESPVQSIEIRYPSRLSFTHGTDWWVVYFFIVSMVAALLFKPLIKVKI